MPFLGYTITPRLLALRAAVQFALFVVFVVAHRDGWFEAANDNASGVSTLLGLAEYFAKTPKEQRRRTMTFLGTSGHHDNSGMSGRWLADPKELFARTALNHQLRATSAEQLLIYRGGVMRRTNTTTPLRWYVSGSPRLEQIVVKAYDQFGVATYAEPEPSVGGEMGPYYQFAPSLQPSKGVCIESIEPSRGAMISGSCLA